MYPNRNDDKSVGSAGALHMQAPRLQAGGMGYAVWAPHMNVYLQRSGAEGIHSKAMTQEVFLQMEHSVDIWRTEALDAAMASVLVGNTATATGSTGSTAGSIPTPPSVLVKVTPEAKASRTLITEMVERAHKVYGILYASLPEEVRTQSAHIAPGWAYGLWHWLETKYQSTEEDAVSDLYGQWSGLSQEDGASFDSYRAQVNKVRDLLKAAKETISDRMYAYTLLDRLQPRYKQAVLALKASGQLNGNISWDAVTSFINSHERSEIRLDTHADGQAMAAASMGRSRASAQQADRTRDGPRTLADVQCFNCGVFGHMRAECDQPVKKGNHGAGDRRPPHKSGFAHPRRQEQAKAAQQPSRHSNRRTVPASGGRYESLSDSEAEEEPKYDHGRTYCAIVVVSMANLKAATAPVSIAQAPRTPQASVPIVHEHAAAVRATQAAPPVAKATSKPASTGVVPKASAEPPQVAVLDESFGVDSMASLHATSNKALFVGPLKTCSPIHVMMANRTFVTVTQYGSVIVRIRSNSGKVFKMPIDRVHYHPSFSTNLLSWNVLRELGWQMHSSKDASFLITPGGNKIHLLTTGRVSMLRNVREPNTTGEVPCVYALGTLSGYNVKALVRLHEKLGHITFKRMVHLMKGGATLDVTKVQASDHELLEAKRRISECTACVQGKGMRTPFGHRGLDTGRNKGETLHMDTYFVKREDGARKWMEYGLTITDPFTQWRWFCRLDSKDQAAARVIGVVRHAQTQLGCKVKRLHADGGTEFVNRTLQDWCDTQGIVLHYTPARTQQLNGVAENAVRSNKDAVRTLLAHGGVPVRFWDRAAKHATFIWNRAHVSQKTGMTPYESMYGKKPSAQSWGVFGCDSFAHVPKEQRSAFDPKVEPCIYLGHDAVQNCAMVYILRTKKVVASRDLTYRNGSFSLCRSLGLDTEVPLSPANESVDAESLEVDSAATSEEDRYSIDAVIDQRIVRGHKEYLVRWTGYDGEDTWQSADQMQQDAPEAVKEFLDSRSGGVAADAPDSVPDPALSPAEAEAAAEAAAADPAPRAPRPRTRAWSVSAPRRSARGHASSRAEDALTNVSDYDDEPDSVDQPQVHALMSAIGQAHSDEDRLRVRADQQIICSVATGVSLLEARTPQTYRAAMASSDRAHWISVMDAEMNSIEEKGVWELVRRADLPAGTNILPVKWVYKIKTDGNGQIEKFKARVTPKGFRQKEGKDYFEVFARTGMYKTMRFGLSLAARFDHELEQLDVPTAFLNADLDEEVYMEVPEGYRAGKDGMVYRLKKALYGLKQAPRNWYLLVSKFIVEEMHYKPCVSDPCLFYRRSRSGRLMLIFLFVDDFQCSFHREDREEWNKLKAVLIERFGTKDMGESKWILGMRIARDRKAGTLTLDQELYLTKALEKYGFAQCRTAPTPEIVGAAHQEQTPEMMKPTDKQRYMEIVGTLMYAAISTRPDITHAVYYLAAWMLDPRAMHMAAAERVLRYIASTLSLGLVFGSRNGGVIGDSRGHTQVQVDVCAYADADWANNKDDRRSVTGWVAKINGDPVSWSSKKQRTVALSTCEAELYAGAAAIQEVLWLRGIVKELGLRTELGSVIRGDNQSALAVSKNGIKGERTKHVDVKYHFVTETVDRGDVQLKWVPSSEQHADIFTKALPVPVFERLRDELMSC
jgi:transposase InsO family protein